MQQKSGYPLYARILDVPPDFYAISEAFPLPVNDRYEENENSSDSSSFNGSGGAQGTTTFEARGNTSSSNSQNESSNQKRSNSANESGGSSTQSVSFSSGGNNANNITTEYYQSMIHSYTNARAEAQRSETGVDTISSNSNGSGGIVLHERMPPLPSQAQQFSAGDVGLNQAAGAAASTAQTSLVGVNQPMMQDQGGDCVQPLIGQSQINAILNSMFPAGFLPNPAGFNLGFPPVQQQHQPLNPPPPPQLAVRPIDLNVIFHPILTNPNLGLNNPQQLVQQHPVYQPPPFTLDAVIIAALQQMLANPRLQVQQQQFNSALGNSNQIAASQGNNDNNKPPSPPPPDNSTTDR